MIMCKGDMQLGSGCGKCVRCKEQIEILKPTNPNGCNEDGWDLYEEQTRQEFEYYAVRRGYSVVRDSEYNFFYADSRTADAWEMYHHGHVKGRGWIVE